MISAIETFLKFKSAEFRSQALNDLRDEIAEETAKSEPTNAKMDKPKAEPPDSVKTTLDLNLVYQNCYHYFGSSLAARFENEMIPNCCHIT